MRKHSEQQSLKDFDAIKIASARHDRDDAEEQKEAIGLHAEVEEQEEVSAPVDDQVIDNEPVNQGQEARDIFEAVDANDDQQLNQVNNDDENEEREPEEVHIQNLVYALDAEQFARQDADVPMMRVRDRVLDQA